MLDFDVVGARKAGYSDDEIAATLASKANFDKDGAEKAGYTPAQIIETLVPSAKRDQGMADFRTGAKELFGRDTSKAGQVSASDYANRALGGAISGAVVGGAVGAFTGPGAIATGTVGAIGGAVSGLIEAGLEDLGFGAGTQFVGGALVPGAGLSTKVGRMIEQKALQHSDKIAGKLAETVSGVPLVGSATKDLINSMRSKTPIDIKAAEGMLGVKGAVADANAVGQEVANVEANIGQKFKQATGTDIPQGAKPTEVIYNTAGSKISEALNNDSFIGSSFFNRAASLNGKLSPAQETKYAKLFEDANGNPLSGADIINNLRSFKSGEKVAGIDGVSNSAARKARWGEGDKLEKEFNGWLAKQPGGQPWQAHARGAFEDVAVAKAKDTLPKMFDDVIKADSRGELRSAAGALDSQIWNLSKDPVGQKAFFEQLLGNASKLPADQTKLLWKEIGPSVQKHMIDDPAKFKEISDIMTGSLSPREISRARRIIMTTLTAGAVDYERNL